MAIIPCGGTWVSQWGIRPQFLLRSSSPRTMPCCNMNKVLTSQLRWAFLCGYFHPTVYISLCYLTLVSFFFQHFGCSKCSCCSFIMIPVLFCYIIFQIVLCCSFLYRHERLLGSVTESQPQIDGLGFHDDDSLVWFWIIIYLHILYLIGL